MNMMRADLPPLPKRMSHLPISEKGFPVPYFAAVIDGKHDIRVADQQKWVKCVQQKRCWLCGEVLGRWKVFVIGPMCAINRVTSEPPCHHDCATYAVKACPFLTRPIARRNDRDLPEDTVHAAGFGIDRNPGATCLWIAQLYKVFKPHAGNRGYLINLGEPASVEWFREGRTATRQEIEESIRTALPFLMDIAEKEGPEAVMELNKQILESRKLLPAE